MGNKIKGDKNVLAGRDVIFNNEIEQEDYGVIETIFDYVLEKVDERIDNNESSLSRDKLLHINDKINLNFTNEGERKNVQEYFTHLFLKISFVENAFASLSSDDQSDIHFYILNSYNKLKRKLKTPIEILETLSEIFIPKNQIKNPNYQSIAQAIVLFFFDDCTIFEKTSKEESQKNLFSDL